MGSREGKNTAIYIAYDDSDQLELATPERNLLRAVLLNAVSDMSKPGEFSRRATDYFLSREDDYLYSFQSVCSYLNINPQHILTIVGLTEDGSVSPVKEPHLAVEAAIEGMQ
jgi:hypothetical protein